MNRKRVERLWRREGLKVPAKQPKRGRLWLNDGSCIRLRPEHPNHVWSYDFVEDRTHDGRKYPHAQRDRRVHPGVPGDPGRPQAEGRSTSSTCSRTCSSCAACPGHVRSDNGPEFVAKAVQGWIAAVGAKTAYIEPGSPWENGFFESFNAQLRDELLDGEIFYCLRRRRSSSRAGGGTTTPCARMALGYKPPAPEVLVPALAAWPAAPPNRLRRPPQLSSTAPVH